MDRCHAKERFVSNGDEPIQGSMYVPPPAWIVTRDSNYLEVNEFAIIIDLDMERRAVAIYMTV